MSGGNEWLGHSKPESHRKPHLRIGEQVEKYRDAKDRESIRFTIKYKKIWCSKEVNELASYLNLRYNLNVHIISRKALIRFWGKYPDSETALARWFKVVDKTEFHSFADLRSVFPSADRVNDLFVFNIAGNKYRLITSIHFNRGKVYVRHVLTHTEYDRGDWKK